MTTDSIDKHCKGAEQSIKIEYSARCHLYNPDCSYASSNNYFPVGKKMYPVCRLGVELIKGKGKSDF